MAPLVLRSCTAQLVVVLLLSTTCFLVAAAEAQAGGRRRAMLSYRKNLHKLAAEEDGSGEQEEESRLPAPPKKKGSTGGSSVVEKAAAGSRNKTLLTKPVKPKKANSTTATIGTAKKGLGWSSSAPLLATKSTGGTGLNKTKTVGPKSTKLSNSTIAAAKLVMKPVKPAKLNSTAGIGKPLKTGLKSLNSTGKAGKKLGDLLVPKLQKKTISSNSPPAAADGKKKSSPQQQKQGGQGNNNASKGGTKKPPRGLAKPTQILPWLDDGDYGSLLNSTDDLISSFRDLPSKFHSTLIPDLHRISTTSKAYITHANREFARHFKPLVGTKYAPSAATAALATTILLPLLLAALLIRCLSPHLPLQKLLLSVHIYLAIYFGTLAFTAALTGHEPLRFFHASSPRFYAATQVMQTLGYAMYLLLQLVHVAAGGRVLGAMQLLVGVAVGLHYHTAVFHRAVVGEPPRTNWRVHAVYAVCFAAVCGLARAERRKKAYLGGGGHEDGKKS